MFRGSSEQQVESGQRDGERCREAAALAVGGRGAGGCQQETVQPELGALGHRQPLASSLFCKAFWAAG